MSLDPYRLESRKILALIKESLPEQLQKVEKASIDEVFMDLSAQVRSVLLERFPELSQPPPYDDPTETLPLPSVAALDWQADALVDLDEGEEALDPDWDDVAILIGSEIVRHLRARIREQLGYTCSAGIANNKLVSKLGSGFKKPNQQTVIRSRAVRSFLAGFKLTKLRNLGGKLGEQVVAQFNTESMKDLSEVTLDQMKAKLGDDTGTWLYNTARGIDTSEVNSRTQIKSMLSAKSFQPSIRSPEQAVKWLRIFVADIYARLIEEGVLDNKRRPRTINLHYRHGGQTRSRQGPIPHGKTLDDGVLLNLSNDLLRQIIAEGQIWPCSNLSLSVGGFEDGVKGNMGMDAFLLKREEIEAARSGTPDSRQNSVPPERPSKKRRAGGEGIESFLSKKTPFDEPAGEGADRDRNEYESDANLAQELPANQLDHDSSSSKSKQEPGKHQTSITSFVCARCEASFDGQEALQNHTDWHFAKDLQAGERVQSTFAGKPAADRGPAPRAHPASSRRGRGGKLEQGQSRLKFG